MPPEFRKLVIHRAEGRATGEEYVDLALAALEAGQDSEHLRMLAGLGTHPHWQDVRDHFGRALEELSLDLPHVAQVIPEYIRDVARSILSGAVEPNHGCHKIYWALQTDGVRVPQQEYEAWLYLDDGLEPGTYRKLHGVEMERAVRQAAARLLQS